MGTTMHDSQEPLTEEDIATAEAELGLSLPEQYKRFLLNYNGGYPEPDAFPIQNNPSDTHGLVHYFLCIKKDDIYNLMTYVTRFRGRVPGELLPIAVDPGGNLICLSVVGANRGQVYFWEHEEEAPEGELPGYGNVYLVADSFDQFFNDLSKLTD